jgi:uncharacterized protein YcbK (DUF882 family)
MKWFKKEDFLCRCGKCEMPAEVEGNLMALVENVLEPAREKLGGPIIVNSGYRCVRHNREVGGVANSQHLRGEAADLRCEDNKRLAKIIEENGRFDQLIIYPTFIHVSFKRLGANRKQVLYKH